MKTRFLGGHFFSVKGVRAYTREIRRDEKSDNLELLFIGYRFAIEEVARKLTEYVCANSMEETWQVKRVDSHADYITVANHPSTGSKSDEQKTRGLV